MDDMQDALRWALHTLRAELAKTCKPDDPIWNDWDRADRICRGKDPDAPTDEPARQAQETDSE